MTLYNFEIGTTTLNVTNLEDLGLDPPFQDAYKPYAAEVAAADGLFYGHGWAELAWRWGFISQADRDILKAYCSAKSSTVYIRVLGQDNTWDYCQAVMVWPEREQPANNGYIFDLAIQFRVIQNYGDSLP